MSDQEKVADLLEAAADTLDEEGWIQHQAGNPRLPGFLNAMCEPQPQKVVEWWNDSPGRTVADVTMTLRKTALTVRERVQP